MANYDQLPVYKATYDLLIHIFHVGQHWRRDLRHTLGENLKQEVLAILQIIYQANATTDKLPYLARARVMIVKVKVMIRIAKDLKLLKVKEFALFVQQTESVSKQLTAWERSVKKAYGMASDNSVTKS